MPFLPYARLLRLPNVFTAFADIGVGVCATIGLNAAPIDPIFSLHVGLLFLASGCLYLGGMVWNDYFDLEEDRRDRPFRPLPSGQISLVAARRLGTVLFMLGWFCALASGSRMGSWPARGGIIATVLIIAILLYDARIKRASFGPIGMAICRFLNVLLGLSLADFDAIPWITRLHLAATVGVYIAGVTWFARTEEKRSNPEVLRSAAFVLLVAVLLALAVPVRVPAGTASPLFPYLLVAFAFIIAIPVFRAIRQPMPENVQAGVKRCILGLVGLDALLASVFVGTPGLLLLLLLPPALWLGKWVYST